MALSNRNPHAHRLFNVNDEQRVSYEEKAMSQELFIYHLFQMNNEMTKSDVKEIMLQLRRTVGDSSIPRALSNLNRDGLIEMTERSEMGSAGRLNHIYKLI